MREPFRTAKFLRDFPQPVAIHFVKGFRKFHEGSVEVSPHLLALLLQLVSGKDHVDYFSLPTEATSAFREQSLLHVSVETIEENAGEDLSGDVQQRDSSVVVAELAVPLLLQLNQTSGGWKQPATVKHDLRGSPLSFLSDRRAVGNGAKPVMGLRQQNQARKTRMALKLNQQQQQLGCGEVNLNRAASHLSQQISEPPLTYHSSDSVGNERLQGTGLTKASSCEDRIRQVDPLSHYIFPNENCMKLTPYQ
ncbi:unnamed protein product [Schistocephalus solidus]|uniref:Uncharacterized protein n=1 Tax=Schistocephalus solidus TaxID=70667 RepID=A0A183STG0_SCHSO|nr:unnamed protein product [Schistocephalus solidus]